MILILGTENSGKSKIAEDIAVKISEEKPVAYIATMIPFDDDGEKRIEKHRKLREGKNFITFEEPYLVSGLIENLRRRDIDYALIECISNLVGNVIHKDEFVNIEDEELVFQIVDDVKSLSNAINDVVIVANYFEIKCEYDDDTKRYIKINNLVNEKLRGISDVAYIKEEGEWMIYENN